MSALKRSKPKSKRYQSTGFPEAIANAIVERDGGCVRCGGALWGIRGVDYSIQHRRARGAGGSKRPDTNAPQNGLALCGSATTGCHGHVERNRAEARDHGWTIWQTEDPLLVAVDHHMHGHVYLYSNGSWGSRPETTDSGASRERTDAA